VAATFTPATLAVPEEDLCPGAAEVAAVAALDSPADPEVSAGGADSIRPWPDAVVEWVCPAVGVVAAAAAEAEAAALTSTTTKAKTPGLT